MTKKDNKAKNKIVEILELNFDPFYDRKRGSKYLCKGIMEKKIEVIADLILKIIEDEVFYEDGHALAWVEWEEMGCPSNKKDTEKKYFLNKKEILRIANEIRKNI